MRLYKTCMNMNDGIKFKKNDRYKLSSYRAYNTKMPGYYDSAYFIKIFKVSDWYKKIADSLLPAAADLQILDVGCGTGTLLAELGKSGFRNLHGIDLAEGILKDAEKKLVGLNIYSELCTGDAEDHIPYEENKFDVVTMTGTFHHFYRPFDALGEILRILKPDGRFILIDQSFISPLRQILNLYLKIFSHDGDYYFYSSDQASRLINEAGFNIKTVGSVGIGAYFIEALC